MTWTKATACEEIGFDAFRRIADMGFRQARMGMECCYLDGTAYAYAWHRGALGSVL